MVGDRDRHRDRAGAGGRLQRRARAGSAAWSAPMSSSSATCRCCCWSIWCSTASRASVGFEYWRDDQLHRDAVALCRRLSGRGVPRRAGRGAERACSMPGKAIGLTPCAAARLRAAADHVPHRAAVAVGNTFVSLFKDTSVASRAGGAGTDLRRAVDQFQHVPHRRGLHGRDADVPGHRLRDPVRLLRRLERRFAIRRCDERRCMRRALPFRPDGRGLRSRSKCLGLVVVWRRWCWACCWASALVRAAPAGVAGPRLQRHHPRHADPGADFLRLLRAAGDRDQLANFAAAVVALTLFSTAQVAEITRGAIQSIHHGQMEAGKAIGLTLRASACSG